MTLSPALHLVLETALDAAIVMGRDGSVRGWNKQAELTFGWSRDEAIGQVMGDLIVPSEYRTAHAHGLKRFLETGSGTILGQRLEVSSIDRSGREFPVELSITATEDNGETVFVGFVRDISARKTEEALKLHHEAQFRHLVDALPVFVSVIDREGRYQLVNRAYEDWFKRPRHEIIGKTVEELFRPKDFTTRRAHLARALGGESVRFETITEGPQGPRLTELLYEPRFNALGDIEGVHVVGLDITERRAVQQALETERDRARNVLENMADGFVLLDRDFRVLQINDSAVRMENRPACEIVGKTHWEAWPGTEHAKIGSVYRTAMQDRNSTSIESVYHHAGRDTATWYETRVEPASEGLALFYRDVTERKLVEEERHASEVRFRTLANVLPALVWLSDGQGQVQFLNDRWYDYVGGGRGETHTYDAQKVVHPADLEIARGLWAHALQTGTGFEQELRIKGDDGQYRWFLSRAEPIRSASRVEGWIGASVDINDRYHAEEHLKLMVNELNHRVKNNLATVQALASQSFRPAQPMPEARDAFIARLGALAKAHDVLTQKQWDGARLADIALGVLSPNFVDMSRLELSGPNVGLTPTLALSLSMAFHELCTNAMKYGALSGAAGTVALTWEVSADDILALTWRERGGPPVSVPEKQGFGTRLLQRSLADQLEGSITMMFQPEGLVCCIEARLG